MCCRPQLNQSSVPRLPANRWTNPGSLSSYLERTKLVSIVLLGRQKSETRGHPSRPRARPPTQVSLYWPVLEPAKENQGRSSDGFDNSLWTAEVLLPPVDHRMDRETRCTTLVCFWRRRIIDREKEYERIPSLGATGIVRMCDNSGARLEGQQRLG